MALMCKIHPREMANCESVTGTELAQQLDRDAKRASALQKDNVLRNKQGKRTAK